MQVWRLTNAWKCAFGLEAFLMEPHAPGVVKLPQYLETGSSVLRSLVSPKSHPNPISTSWVSLGYYADPENCRWFFACLDHGKSPLQAYEFRCPFGLVFDGDRLVCEWPWLVPKCSNGAGSGLGTGFYYGGSQNQGAPGLILQSYDGLGSLGAVKLGGVSGTIEKPITALYTNAASGALGLGYENHQAYIGGGGGLTYKEAQALQNAGFLRVNNGVGYQASGENGQVRLGTNFSSQTGFGAFVLKNCLIILI